MSDFTQGPWKVFTVQSGPNIGQLLGVGQETGQGVTDAYGGLWGSGPEQMANARLISAAPDLLEALERMVDHFATWASDMPETATTETYAALFTSRAAIAKALGQ